MNTKPLPAFFTENTDKVSNDDIVTRLHGEFLVRWVTSDELPILREAANTIERLREKVGELRVYAEQDACTIKRLQRIIEEIDDLHDWGSTDDPCCRSCGVWPCPTHLLVCNECRTPNE